MVEYQNDDSKYGRGEMHLSATLDVGDVVVYQTGSWYVDGVQVGDDTTSTPTFHYGLVETIQIVWTHNCEHGVIRVWPMTCSMQQKTTMTSGDEDNRHGPLVKD